MGQMQVESQGFTKAHENLRYSGQNVFKALHKHHPDMTQEDASAIAVGGPEKVAEAIYGGRRDLGNTEPGDGWKFHGRGFVQLTGRYNYERYGKALGLDLANHPDLASEPANAAKIAVQYWKERVVARGHQHDITRATEDINGGHNGLKERQAAATHWEGKLARGYKPGDPEPGQSLQDSPLFKQAKSALEKIDAQFGRKPDQSTHNAAAAITVAALRGGLTRIDHMTLGGNDNSTIFAIQGKPGTALSKVVDVPTVESMNTPVAQSSQAFTVVQQARQQAPQQNNQQAPQQTAPAMSR
jgi:predicted chitinase